ncbi:MAG TPA: hypothetical protein VLJ38_03790, partial [Polyangiaceae bacterium]|nr:hypothetical protein [Polyangiaceae bacterium]
SDAVTNRDAKVLARELLAYPEPPGEEEASFVERHNHKSAGAESCPRLVARSDVSRTEDACPPLSLSFAGATERLFADVSFTPSGNVQEDRSPHLAQLAKLLALRTELELLGVRTATRAHAEAVIRQLESRGVEKGRLVVDRLLDASLPTRKPVPKCPSVGEQVVFEVQKMGLSTLYRNIRQHPPAPVASPPFNRFETIQALLRFDPFGRRGPGALEDALSASRRWVAEERDNPLAYVSLGDALAAAGHQHLAAARAYGSLFDFELPGAGLVMAAAVRLELNAGTTPDARRHDGTAAQQERVHDVGVQTFQRAWQDHPEQAEGARAYAYAKYREGDENHAWCDLYEAAKYSAVAERVELPVFAHLYLKHARQEGILESLLAGDCSFPMQAPVHGAVMSWEDTQSELEVSVTSEPKHFEYASVLSDQGGVSRAKWLPLPADDAAYPIHVTVRATKLGARGYAFGVLRVINYNGRGRMSFDEKPFVATDTAPVEVYSEHILQVPQ